jgi:hypothetical protein
VALLFTHPDLKTGNPNLIKPELADLAKDGLAFEWDFKTFDGVDPKLMLDQSGNGHNATFLNNPSTDALGVNFNDGVNYAEGDTTAYGSELSLYFAYTLTGAGGSYYMMTNGDVSTQTGISVYAVAGQNPVGRYGNSSFVTTALGTKGGQTNLAANKWGIFCLKNKNGSQRMQNLLSRSTTVLRNITSAPGTLPWRVGGGRAAGGALYLPITNLKMGYMMLAPGWASPRHDAARMEYIYQIMKARGAAFP